MKVRKGQSFVSIDGLVQVISVKASEWKVDRATDQRAEAEVWTVLRIQAQVVERDPTLRGEGRPVKYVQSGEELFLFPVPDGPYWVEVTYHGVPKKC